MDTTTFLLILASAFVAHRLFRRRDGPKKERKTTADRLDRLLWTWPTGDPYRLRDLLNGGIVILGRPGSGKSSSSGKTIARKLLEIPGSGGLICASSPTDVAFWTRLFKAAGRSKDLILFGPKHDHQFNLVRYLEKLGLDHRDLARVIVTIGEAIDSDSGGGGRESEKFWVLKQKQQLETAIAVVRMAEGSVTLPAVFKFIATGPTSQESLTTDAYINGYQNQCFRKAHAKTKSLAEQYDLEHARNYWHGEVASQDHRVRSSIDAGLTGIFHVFMGGTCRSLLCEGTTVSPDVMDDGGWILADCSVGQYGSTGAFLLNALRVATQQKVLRRDPDVWRNPIFIFADEAGKIVNSGDMHYLTESRKFGGATVFLAQSIHSFAAAFAAGDQGQAQSKNLLASFATTILHSLGDPYSAEWASKCAGSREEYSMGGSTGKGTTLYDAINCESGGFSANFTPHVRPILEPKAFMHGLRTGGPPDNVADAWVITTGVPFADGENHLFTTWSQE